MTQAERILENIETKLKHRRGFIRQLGLASAGVGAFLAKAQAQSTITDGDIVQFALNLEYLEAEFYTVARLGKTIDQMGIGITGSGTAGATTGGQKVTFTEGSTLATATDQIGAGLWVPIILFQSQRIRARKYSQPFLPMGVKSHT